MKRGCRAGVIREEKVGAWGGPRDPGGVKEGGILDGGMTPVLAGGRRKGVRGEGKRVWGNVPKVGGQDPWGIPTDPRGEGFRGSL